MTVSDGAWQEAADGAGEDFALLVDPAAIDPASWVPAVLHAPRPDRAYASRGSASALFGRVATIGAPAPRGAIPADRILHMPDEPMRVLHAPPAFASFAPPRRQRRYAIVGRRGWAIVGMLLVACLFGTWGAFFSDRGGQDFAPRGKTIVSQMGGP